MTTRRLATLLAVVLALAAVAFVFWPLPPPEVRSVAWERHAGGPLDELRVAWVGHSLMDARDPSNPRSESLPERVGTLASAAGAGYDHVAHLRYGAPLSMLWRGSPHSYDRREPELVAQRESFLREEGIDALVLTEGLPIRRSLELEHSSHYAQRFACGVLEHNPNARVYVYESWSHWNASDPDGEYPRPSVYDWDARIRSDRAHWTRLADEVTARGVPAPGLKGKWDRLVGGAEAACASTSPAFLVPVGEVMRALVARAEREDIRFAGRTVTGADLFANPYTSWPAGWPVDEAITESEEGRALAALSRRFPDRELDDIHPSDLGIYVASLTHFATLYRRSPVGLPGLVNGLDEASAARLQRLVWEVVRAEPRAGVRE